VFFLPKPLGFHFWGLVGCTHRGRLMCFSFFFSTKTLFFFFFYNFGCFSVPIKKKNTPAFSNQLFFLKKRPPPPQPLPPKRFFFSSQIFFFWEHWWKTLMGVGENHFFEKTLGRLIWWGTLFHLFFFPIFVFFLLGFPLCCFIFVLPPFSWLVPQPFFFF